jgi:AbrB family looped-hinge helix DNA binding protein
MEGGKMQHCDPRKPTIYGTAVVNDKGQVVIPADARADMGLQPGTRVIIMATPIAGSVAIVDAKVIEAQTDVWTNALGMKDEAA